MPLRTLALALTTAAVLPAAAHDDPRCTREPQEARLPDSAIREKAAALGHAVKFVEISGPCYEISGNTEDGTSVEVYVNPVTGAEVKLEIE